ncbi:ATP-binding protein [Streptomyces sp. NPDC005761]|uniref:ATP-binding protein n=1 Tax=unclassified Streptomyces TaxID=2593676 RepID=UPI0033D88550
MTEQCTDPFPSTQTSVTGSVSSPRKAAEGREAAAAFLTELNPPPSPSAVQSLLLLSSELVTNAIRHAGAVTSLSFRADRSSLHVQVADPSPARPQARTPDMTGRSGGFGWPMVLRLADRVTIRTLGNDGKIILAALPR